MTAQPVKSKKMNRTKLNVFLDLALAAMFVMEMEQNFTGMPMHEVLGLVFGTAFAIHIILHWDWIVNITRTFFKTMLHESRVNYVLNLALFIDLIVVTITGIGISRTLGLNLDVPHSWESVHIIASELTLALVALHVAMHWKWIATNAGKYLLPKINFRRKKSAAMVSMEVQNGTAS